MSISIVVEIKSKSDDNIVKSILSDLAIHSKSEVGCKYYQSTLTQENTFLLTEKWSNEEAVNIHNDSDHFKTLVPALVENSDIKYLKKFKIYKEYDKIVSNDDLYVNQNTIRLIVFVEVKNEENFIQLANELAMISNTESGCLEYTFAKSLDNENEYIFIEVWQDEDALSKHSGSDHCKRLLPLLDIASTVKSVVKGINKI